MISRRLLLKMLGTYFSKNFHSDKFINGLLEGTLALQKQVETNMEELILSAYRKRIPIHHTEHVYTFALDPMERNNTADAYVKFGSPYAFFLDTPKNSPNWLKVCDRYGVHNQTQFRYKLPLSCVVSVEKIVDNPYAPTFELYPGEHFELDRESIRFFKDPCANGKSCELFLINIKQDFRWIYKHFGYLLGLKSKSSRLYREIVDDIYNAYIDASSAVDVFDILAEVTGNIVSRHNEKIKEITSDKIVTNQNTYELLPGHSPRVVVGEVVSAGDSLTKEFTPIYINRLNQTAELTGVLLPKRFLGPEYHYGITFINAEVPIYQVEVEGPPKGTHINITSRRRQSRFYLGGNRHDVELFWQDFEKHCLRSEHGLIMAHYTQDKQDNYRNKYPNSDYPELAQAYLDMDYCVPDDLSVNAVIRACQINGKINPYKFFTEHIGRYHYTLLALDHVNYPTDVRLDHVPLRRLMPPTSALIIQQRIQIEDNVSMAGVSNDDLSTDSFILIEGCYKFKIKPCICMR